jgi:hypothetical protein
MPNLLDISASECIAQNSKSSATSIPSISFVCCIESGRLESQTLLMLKTFRKFGGRLSNCTIFAVKARAGARLSQATLQAMQELDVNYIDDSSYNVAPWFNFSNKLAAVYWSQCNASTELISWLDSDILIASEPSELLLDSGVDFAARAEYLPPAVHEGIPTNVPYWQSLCKLLGTNFDELPWISLDSPMVKMRAFFNSGAFVWRRSSGFAENYYSAFDKLLKSKLASSTGTAWFADQVVISPVLVKHDIKWRHLSLAQHHMVFPGHITGSSSTPSMKNSSIIHYSGSLSGESEPEMLKRLFNELPDVHKEVLEHREGSNVPKLKLMWVPLSLLRKLRLWYFLKTLNVAKVGV